MNTERLEEKLAELPLYAYFFIGTQELSFSSRIRYICQTECPMYGKTWACPPAVGTVEACQKRVLDYRDALVIATTTQVEDISNLEETLSTRAEHEEITRQAAQMVRDEMGEVFVLSTEACAICAECAYPDGPCRHPDKMNPCVESYGIVLTELLDKYGLDFQYGSNVVTWYSIIFFHKA